MTSILFFLEPLVTNYIYLYISHLLTTQTETTNSSHLHACIRPWAFCTERRLINTVKKKTNKNVYSYIYKHLFSFFSSWFHAALPHIFLRFVWGVKQLYKGTSLLAPFFSLSLRICIHIHYIYIFYVCQLHKQKWRGGGEHENITVVGGRQQRLQNGSVEKNTTASCCRSLIDHNRSAA